MAGTLYPDSLMAPSQQERQRPTAQPGKQRSQRSGQQHPARQAIARLQGIESGYGGQQPQPLAGYAILTGAFALGYTGLMIAAKAGNRLPRQRRRPALRDIVLLGVAARKLAALIARDKVTSFLRAPFATFERMDAGGTVKEQPRGRGFRRAVGELLTCPYCVGLWTTAGLAGGEVFAPRVTRFAESVLAAYTLADVLQLGYWYASHANAGQQS